jgi:hypothetical protein
MHTWLVPNQAEYTGVRLLVNLPTVKIDAEKGISKNFRARARPARARIERKGGREGGRHLFRHLQKRHLGNSPALERSKIQLCSPHSNQDSRARTSKNVFHDWSSRRSWHERFFMIVFLERMASRTSSAEKEGLAAATDGAAPAPAAAGPSLPASLPSTCSCCAWLPRATMQACSASVVTGGARSDGALPPRRVACSRSSPLDAP